MGVVTRVRHRKPAEAGSNSQKGSQRGAQGRKPSTKAGKSQQSGPREALEIHLRGGETPSDVIMIEAWDPVACMLLKPHAVVGKFFQITNIDIKEHSEKSAGWTTSRLQFYGQMIPSTQI